MAEEDVETITVSIESEDGRDEIAVPATLVDLLAEEGQGSAEAVADVTLLSFASRAHHLVHHDEGVGEDLEAAEAEIMDRFEERFGVTFGEATGHQH